MIAMRAANREPTIRAVYSTSVFGGWGITPSFWASSERGGKRVLPDGRLRIATGNEELNNGWSWLWGQNAGDYSGLRTFTGQSCADGTVSCLRANGSGWHVVQSKTSAAGPTDGTADHCFMSVNGLICAVPQPTDSYWLTGSAPWSFATALRWLKGQVS